MSPPDSPSLTLPARLTEPPSLPAPLNLPPSRQITMNDLPVGRSVDETLRLVQAFMYTDKHGEVCPAGWTPGADTIIPDPKEKLQYFKKQGGDL